LPAGTILVADRLDARCASAWSNNAIASAGVPTAGAISGTGW
jgi:hypothetical protein